MREVKDLREYIGREDELEHVKGWGIHKIVEKPGADRRVYPLLVMLDDGDSFSCTVDGRGLTSLPPCVGLKEKPKVYKTLWRRRGWLTEEGNLRTGYLWCKSKKEFDETLDVNSDKHRWSDEWESITIEVEE